MAVGHRSEEKRAHNRSKQTLQLPVSRLVSIASLGEPFFGYVFPRAGTLAQLTVLCDDFTSEHMVRATLIREHETRDITTSVAGNTAVFDAIEVQSEDRLTLTFETGADDVSSLNNMWVYFTYEIKN